MAAKVKHNTAFTLVELLLVVAIIAVLIALLMPAIQKAKNQATSVRCAANQRQIGLAFFSYTTAWKGYLPIESSSGYHWWEDCFQNSVYISNDSKKTIATCPNMNTGSYYGVFGLHNANASHEIGSLIITPPPGHQQNIYMRLMFMPRPANWLLLADSSCDTDPPYSAGDISKFKTGSDSFGAYGLDNSGTPYARAAGIWLAHGTANGMFADLHVEACTADRLKAVSNYNSTYGNGIHGAAGIYSCMDQYGAGIP